jgi:hypothetical protein
MMASGARCLQRSREDAACAAGKGQRRPLFHIHETPKLNGSLRGQEVNLTPLAFIPTA